jgi:hypothetical protein
VYGGTVSGWKNKHVVIATLMAPVLALIAYFGVNFIVGEDPRIAEAGNSYKLVEKPNCRYGSGACGLKNADFELTLTFEWLDSGQMRLNLQSEYPLDGVLVASVKGEAGEELPEDMLPVGPDGLTWAIDIPRPDPEQHRLHLVASAAGVLYFGDAATRFTLTENTTY